MQESVAAAGPAALDHFFAVAGHEKDSQTGPQLQCDFRKFASAEFRHHYVGKQQIDPAWIALTQSQTFEPIAGVDNNAAIGLEYRADQLADLDFVIDLQNDVALTGGNRSRPRSRISGGSCSCIFCFQWHSGAHCCRQSDRQSSWSRGAREKRNRKQLETRALCLSIGAVRAVKIYRGGMIFATSRPEMPISIRSLKILRPFGEPIGADANIRLSPEAPKPSTVGNPKNFPLSPGEVDDLGKAIRVADHLLAERLGQQLPVLSCRRESSLLKTSRKIRAFAHQVPDQAGLIILDHKNDRPLVQAENPRRTIISGTKYRCQHKSCRSAVASEICARTRAATASIKAVLHPHSKRRLN